MANTAAATPNFLLTARPTKIAPRRSWIGVNVRELWQYRELLYFLTWRDIKVRYKQTVLGAGWAIVQPLVAMLVFSLFFGRLAKMPSDGIPYPLFAFAALVPWTFFANALTQSSGSLVADAPIIRRVYLPRLALPISAVLSGLVDMAIALTLLAGMIVFSGTALTMRLVWLPVFVLLALFTALGIGLWLCALNVEYRDVRYAIPFVIQCWLFITPVAYPSSLVPEQWRTIYALNPMVGVVEGFRWSLFGGQTVAGSMLAVSGLASVALTIGGAIYFRSVEQSFADLV